MNSRTNLKLYFRVRPVRLRDALRLYVSYVASFLFEFLAPSKFKSTGYMIPGKSRLIVEVGGVFFFVTAKTDSLALLSGLHEPRTVNWFRVESGDVVVDGGAHIGRYSLLAAKCASKVISIKPEPSNFPIGKSELARFGSGSATK